MTPNQDLQVVILCGGMGTRIRDVTDDIPKPMIPIGGKPIVWHVMQSYARHGFRRFVLCLGYKGWSIKQFFLDYHLAHGDLSVHLGRHNSVKVLSRPDFDDWEVVLAETGQETMTGGRVKIGYQLVLRLLQDGARVLVTTRFPHAAARRFPLQSAG